MEFFSSPKFNPVKREKPIFIPRFVKARTSNVVINDLGKTILITVDTPVDLIAVLPLNELSKSRQLQQALKLHLIVAEENESYL